MLACGCLNVIIECEINECHKVTVDSLNLTEEEKQDNFFKQDINQVTKLGGINKEHSGLIVSKSVGSWIVHQCINCSIYTHAIHRNRGAAFVLVAAKLLTLPSITELRTSKLYSNIFNILISADQTIREDRQTEKLPNDVQLALSTLKQRVTEVVNREIATTEDKVRQFTEQQYAALEGFREQANKEHKILARLILDKRVEAVPTHCINNEMLSSPVKPKPMENVKIQSPNMKMSIEKPKHKIVTLKSPHRTTLRQMSSPGANTEFMDSEGLFQLEGIEDIDPIRSDTDETDDDLDKEEGTRVSRCRSQSISLAKSLPMTIPIYRSPFGPQHADEDVDDAVLLPGEHPEDIAASIKALAKSVHGDKVFGDLPRPRFSTQI